MILNEKFFSIIEKINAGETYDELTFGVNELYDLIENSYIYCSSNIEGYLNDKKITKINEVFGNGYILFSINGIIILIILSLYIFYTVRIYNIEIYFVNKLLNFNSEKFEGYLKQLNEIKKKMNNDNIEEEEEKDDIEMNEFDSKKETKVEKSEIKKIKDKKKEKKKDKQTKLQKQKD